MMNMEPTVTLLIVHVAVLALLFGFAATALRKPILNSAAAASKLAIPSRTVVP